MVPIPSSDGYSSTVSDVSHLYPPCALACPAAHPPRVQKVKSKTFEGRLQDEPCATARSTVGKSQTKGCAHARPC